jgi:transcriptional regulator with XRE-family HTH domain
VSTKLIFNHHAVRNARIRKGWSTVDLAREAGMPYASVLRIEQAKNRGEGPRLESLIKLAKALGMDHTEFYAEVPAELPGATVTQGVA